MQQPGRCGPRQVGREVERPTNLLSLAQLLISTLPLAGDAVGSAKLWQWLAEPTAEPARGHVLTNTAELCLGCRGAGAPILAIVTLQRSLPSAALVLVALSTEQCTYPMVLPHPFHARAWARTYATLDASSDCAAPECHLLCAALPLPSTRLPEQGQAEEEQLRLQQCWRGAARGGARCSSSTQDWQPQLSALLWGRLWRKRGCAGGATPIRPQQGAAGACASHREWLASQPFAAGQRREACWHLASSSVGQRAALAPACDGCRLRVCLSLPRVQSSSCIQSRDVAVAGARCPAFMLAGWLAL